MTRIFLFFAFFYAAFGVCGQEFRCNVSVSSSRVEGTNKQVFESMRTDIYEFMNNRKWSDNVFNTDERIECTIFIQITQQLSSDEFSGTMQIQLNRPVFNSSYNSPLLNLKDNDIQFKYVDFQPMEYDETGNSNPLTNMLAYYADIILGFDYDTYSPLGGTAYFQKARDIVNRSQNAREKGWRAFEGNFNRFWLVENLTNKAYGPFRELLYRYHRLGLDLLAEKPDMGRAEIADALKNMQRVYRSKPDTYVNRLFFEAKSDELVNIFSKGSTDEKGRVMSILTECDPSNSGKYQKIMEQKIF